MSLRVYYLDQPLSGEDLQFVSEELASGNKLEQVRVPYVLPVLAEGLSLSDLQGHEQLLRKHLRTVGISNDRDKQIVLVAPKDMHWYSVLVGAVVAETGIYPYLVQTEAQRNAIGNPGATRILDTQGLMGLEELRIR